MNMTIINVHWIIVCISIVVAYIRTADAGYCQQSYSCNSQCARTEHYSTKCGRFGWRRCGRTRTVYYSCYKTCNRQVCCSGYTGSDCNTPICYGQTSCLNNNKCTAPNTCSCKTGYKLPKCEDINECATNKGGCNDTCTNTVGSYICSCKTGYNLATDLHSCEDDNECVRFNNLCGQVCTNTEGSYKCECRVGYKMADNGKDCLDEDECAAGTDKCDHSCTNTVGSYVCTCKQGYALNTNGHTCDDVNECSQTPYPCDQACKNTPGSFSCHCNPGYRLNTTADKCLDIDECQESDLCQHDCINTEGSYKCICRHGYTLQLDDHTCKDTDECSDGTSKCSQLCTNTIGNYTCGCRPGFKLAADGATCLNIDDCEGVTCQHGGVCIDGVQSYTCRCAAGYTGKHCENDINECAGFLKGGCEDVCVNTVGSFHCQCTGNKNLTSDSFTCSGKKDPSIFKRHGWLRRFLPRGCHMLQLASCGADGTPKNLLLSSTSPWYQLRKDANRYFTYGIVFVEANAISLPVSISGMEVIETASSFELRTGGLYYDVSDGRPFGSKINDSCWSFNLTPRDVRDFLASNSFLASYFNKLEEKLPDWLRFSYDGTQLLQVNDLHTSLSKGAEIKKTECRGAPLYSNHYYTVLKFGKSFALSLYGQKVKLPSALNNKKFCIITDMCQNSGASVFLILPEESRDMLDKFDMVKQLQESSGMALRPVGLGISLKKKIDVQLGTTYLQQWNGDEIIRYPVFHESNLWIGGKMIMKKTLFKMEADGNVFVSVPSPANILKSLFIEEWGLVMKIALTGTLEFRFKVLSNNGNTLYQTIKARGVGEMSAVASFGGDNRRYCGANSNPAGLFFSCMFEASAFLDVPILSFITLDADVKAYAFMTSDPRTPANNDTLIDIAKHVLNLKNVTIRFRSIAFNILDRAQELIDNGTLTMIVSVKNLTIQFEQIIDDVLNGVTNFRFSNLKTVLRTIKELWKGGWKKLQNDAEAFLDAIREDVKFAMANITREFEQQLTIVQTRVSNLMAGVAKQVSLIQKEMTGVGFRFIGNLNLLGLKIYGLEIEFVYAIDNLGACSRFERAYRVLKGERAVRVLAVRSHGFTTLGNFFRLDVGQGIGVAVSLDDYSRFAAQLRVQVGLLGLKVQADLFLTREGLTCYLEGNVWKIFKAQIEIFTDVGRDWDRLDMGVKGKFVADADDDGDFDDSYLDALKRFTQTIADNAEKRISALQDGVTKAQNGLSKAQDWLEGKKQIFRDADEKFDEAVEKLERAKEKLENAKKPFQDAMSKLSAAQRKVDRLCRIRSCRKICIPGVKCRICHKKVWRARIPYPCCRFTSCMVAIPDPICVAFNVLCRAARALAYAALEAAKIFVRAPMLALDGAKAIVSVAQFVVDKARVVLDIAIAALDLAKLGLEAAKSVLEGAKQALEAIKQVVKIGFAAMNFIIQYGIQSIIDVKDCGFEVRMSTHDLAVFDVHCDVNAFKTGFRTVQIRVNFNDVFQSLWNAAKATITSVLDSIKIFGRKRREIEYQALNTVYKHYRRTRDFDIESEDPLLNNTDIGATNTSATNSTGEPTNADSEYEMRTKMFELKCREFKKIHSFLSGASNTLMEMANETATTLFASNNMQSNLTEMKNVSSFSNMSLEDLGIDTSVASQEFNISMDSLNSAVNEAKDNLTNDPYLNNIEGYASDASEMLQNQTEEANKLDLVLYWLAAMDNTTSEYFDKKTCVSFTDCAHHAVALLYEMIVPSSDLPNKNESLDIVSTFEDTFLNLTSNRSLSVLEVFNVSQEMQGQVQAMNDTNVFCSVAPTAVATPTDATAVTGQTVRLICNATGDPKPKITWFKNGERITNVSTTNVVLTIRNVSKEDEGKYHCTATNLVTTLVMPEAFVQVEAVTTTTKPPLTVPPKEKHTFPAWLTILLLVVIIIFILVVVVVVILFWKRGHAKPYETMESEKKVEPAPEAIPESHTEPVCEPSPEPVAESNPDHLTEATDVIELVPESGAEMTTKM